MRRILVIENIFSDKTSGGIPVYIQNMIKANPHLEFTVIGTGKKKWIFSKFFCVSERKIGHVSYLYKVFFFILKNKLINKYEIVHFHRYDIAVLGVFFKLFRPTQIYTTLHGDHLNSLKSKKSKLRQQLYKGMAFIGRRITDAVILVNSEQQYMVRKKQKYKVIPVGIDITNYGLRKPNKADKTKFLYVGRMDKEKGIDFLIENFHKYGKGKELIIIGDGPLYSELTNKYKEVDNIFFLGFIGHDEIHRYYNQSHCLLLASEFEGSPTTVREALYFNCNILSLDVGDIKKLFSKFDGVKIVTKDGFGHALNSFKYVDKCLPASKVYLIDSNRIYREYYCI